ncbi:MAG: rod shape-determining protein MreC, partial [Methylophilaceae bacterium 17-44-8]
RQSPDSPFAKIVSTPIAGVNNHLQLLILSLPEAEENTVVAEQKKSIAPPVTASNNAIQPNQATPNAPR